ncbi:MAG: polyprenyl synthetase family protein [Desulfobacterales bacterium]|nr:polyprenyl synthetase family protein [Desulfobacterales bacterium]
MSDLKTKILAAVSEDLDAIERALAENLTPHFDLTRDVAGHILFGGGKRLRPLLMVLAARVCDYTGDKAATYSIIFEYLHAATLLHDDLVDEALVRRGKPVANTVWGNSTAVLTGDFLLARSLSLAADTGRIEVIRTIARITEMMSQGEIQQLNRKGDLALSEEDYMAVIECKTAVLFQGACRTGALVAQRNETDPQALADYGYNLGLAFQMADDLLDYTLDSAALGKVVGADLREGKLTMPVIHALENAGTKDRKTMETIIRNPDFSMDDFKALIEMLRVYNGIRYTRETAKKYVDRAKVCLDRFGTSATKEILCNIADYALQRKA